MAPVRCLQTTAEDEAFCDLQRRVLCANKRKKMNKRKKTRKKKSGALQIVVDKTAAAGPSRCSRLLGQGVKRKCTRTAAKKNKGHVVTKCKFGIIYTDPENPPAGTRCQKLPETCGQ